MRFIRYALSIGAFEFPPEGFMLKGKRRSPYLFNSGTFCTGESIDILARAYAMAIAGHFRPEVVFGSAYKGIPIVTALAPVLGKKVSFAYNRKEEKDHGEGRNIVGAALKGKDVLGIDDVITGGGSLLELRKMILDDGGIPIGGAIAFDRQEIGNNGSQSAIQDLKDIGITVCAVATLADLILCLTGICKTKVSNSCDPSDIDNSVESPREKLQKLLDYQELYGAS